MKRLIIFLMMFVFAAPVFATEEEKEREKEPRITSNITLGFASSYIDAISGEIIADKFVFQPQLKIIDKSGVYFNVWLSNKGGFKSDSANEIDYFIGVAKDVDFLIFQAIDVGYYFADIKNSKGDLHGPYAQIDFKNIYGITPYVYLQQNIPQKKEILEGGFLYRTGLKYTIESIGRFNQPIDLDVSIAGHDGVYRYRPEAVSSGRITVSTAFKVWRGIEIVPEINYQRRFGHNPGTIEEIEDEEGNIKEIYHPGGIIEDSDKIWGGIKIVFPIL